MFWNDLSEYAKGIIEWIEHPYTGKPLIVQINCGDRFEPGAGVSILVTEQLLKEIQQFVKEDPQLEVVECEGKFAFRSKKHS